MTFKLKTLTTSALLSALALTGQTASAHPSFVNGGNPNGVSFKNNTPTTYQAQTTPTVRGYMEDAIRIAHGCDLLNTGSNVDPVVAVSWLWPTGKGGTGNWAKAPLSTGCDATGANCDGYTTRASVAKVPDSSKKPNIDHADNPTGLGTATTLASELIEGTTTGAPADPAVPVTTLNPAGWGASRFQFAGNLGYFTTNVTRAPQSNYGGGWWAKGNKFNAAQIANLGIGSAGAPYHNAFQALWAVDQNSTTIRKFAFSSTSCARKLVVRPAGADICKLDNSVAAYNADPHMANFWMGGPTGKFNAGHGIHENFWLNYTLLIRDTAVNPYPNTCTDQVNGDYDLVVMPSINEINSYLPYNGFAKTP